MSSTPIDSNPTPADSSSTPPAPPDPLTHDPSTPSSFENRHSKLENEVSANRLLANRANAQKSTGPRSPEGKARSSLNGLTHGLRSRLNAQTLIPNDEREQFTDFLADLRESLDPQNPLEDYLAERVALLAWQLRRAAQAQVHLLDATRRAERRNAVAHNKQPEDSPASHILYLFAQSGSATLNTLHRYQSSTERAFYHALTQYRLLHDTHAPPPPDLHHHFHYHRHESAPPPTPPPL